MQKGIRTAFIVQTEKDLLFLHNKPLCVHFMAISKTKKTLIEVARQLFAKRGIDKTTMNDIAEASMKGRRTLYTYFKNKKEIYTAVIESEIESLHLLLRKVVKKELPADEKLMLFFFTRLDAIKEVVTRNGTLRADFFRDIWRVENVRKGLDKEEIVYLQQILDEGVTQQLFEINDTIETARIMHYALKGLEVSYIRGTMSRQEKDQISRENIADLIFNGIRKTSLKEKINR